VQEQEKDVMERARHDAEQGKSASTQAGEFVREEMHHIREGKHGAQFGGAGHCHWAVQGATCRREVAGAEEGQSLFPNSSPGRTRSAGGKKASEA